MLVDVVAVLPQVQLVAVVVGHVRLEQDPVCPGRKPLSIVVWSSNPRVFQYWNNPKKLSISCHRNDIWTRGDLLLVFIGRRESWQGLLQLSKSLPILPSLAQLVSSQKLTQLVLLHQTHHLRSESSKQISHLSICGKQAAKLSLASEWENTPSSKRKLRSPVHMT